MKYSQSEILEMIRKRDGYDDNFKVENLKIDTEGNYELNFVMVDGFRVERTRKQKDVRG